MSKKDYEAAALIIQECYDDQGMADRATVEAIQAAFIEFFSADSPRFDVERFLRACEPGANVKARRKRGERQTAGVDA